MPQGTLGSLILIALCFAGAAWCFVHVSDWRSPWTVSKALFVIAGVLVLIVGLVIAALLLAAKLA